MAYPARRLPFEELTSIDERVDFVHDQLTAVQLSLNKLLEKEELPTMAVVTRQVPMRATVLASQGVRVSEVSPLTGKITQIVPHWPPGCNALVEIAFGHKDTWVMPSLVDTFLALDNATPVFVSNEPIEKGEELWMIVRNGDGANPHTVSVAVTIIGVG
jgi:hypothetical protein